MNLFYNLKRLQKPDTFRLFGWLLISGILVKVIGILRESVIASAVGSTIEFANFNFFKSIVDFSIAFVIGSPIIETVLIPLLSPIYHLNNDVSFYNIARKATKVSVIILLVSIMLFSTLSYLINSDNLKNNLIYSLIFSIFSSLYFLNSFYFSLLKVKGNFKSYSVQLTINTIVGFILLLIIINQIGFWAILISGIIYIPFSNWYIRKQIKLTNTDAKDLLPNIKLPKNTLSYFVVLGHSTFVGFFCKIVIGIENNVDINYFHYAFILIYSFQNLVVANFSSVVLYKISSGDKFDFKNIIYSSIAIPFLFIACFYFGGALMVKVLFEHGLFKTTDSLNVVIYMKKYLIIPFALFCSSQILIQPLLSSTEPQFNTYKNKLINIIASIIMSISLITLFSKLYFHFSNNEILLFFLYSTSVIMLLLSAIGFRKILTLKNKC